mmetsp:Transcript_3103/g.7123  ORF Transcript_3103/g.7123 Transcript_3103/m.7123 type:complete len:448 (+) Transcript_3103:68-1411(+)
MADGTATLEVADSRFLAFVRPAASSQDAASLQAELKSRFPDAAHVPIGWLCSLDSGSRDVMRWSDDDGEPESASIGHLLTSEIENMVPNTEGLSVAVVRWFGHRLLGVTCGRLSQCYESVAELGLHRHLHLKTPLVKEVLQVDKNVFGLAAGDTEVILDVVSENLLDKIVSELEFEGFRGSKDEELPRKQNLQADGVDEGIIPVYRYPGNYSGNEWQTFSFSPTCKMVKASVEEALLPLWPQKMNHAVANLYRAGDDYIAHHSDKDLDLDREGVIVSVSLGEERILELRRRAQPRDVTRIVLPHGSMLVLGPISNKLFTHSILKKEDSVGPRLSLTMRNVKTFLYMKNGRHTLFGQGVAAKTLEEVKRSTVVENTLLVASSAAGAAFALSTRFANRNMKAKEALLFGTTYALTVYSLKLLAGAFLKRKEEREARAFFSRASVSGTQY